MSQYEEIFEVEGESEEELSAEEAVLAISFITMFADSEVSLEENEALNNVMSNLGFYDNYSVNEVNELLSKITRIFNDEGAGILLNTAVAALPEKMLGTAFATAVGTLFIDGELPEEEEEFVGGLQQVLGIPDDVAEEIINAVAGE